MEFEEKLKRLLIEKSVPEEISPNTIMEKLISNNSEEEPLTAGVFLKRLKVLKVSGNEFLDLLGNSKIGNAEFRRIEENAHLKYEELIHLLDNSSLDVSDYEMLLEVASYRRRREDEKQKAQQESLQQSAGETETNTPRGLIGEAPVLHSVPEEQADLLRKVDGEVKSELNNETNEDENIIFSSVKDQTLEFQVKNPDIVFNKEEKYGSLNDSTILFSHEQIADKEKDLVNTPAVDISDNTEDNTKDDTEENTLPEQQTAITDDEQNKETETIDEEAQSNNNFDTYDDDDLDEEILPTTKAIGETLSGLVPDNYGSKSKKKTNILVDIMGVIILLGLGVGAYFLNENGYLDGVLGKSSSDVESQSSHPEDIGYKSYEEVFDKLLALAGGKQDVKLSDTVPEISVSDNVETDNEKSVIYGSKILTHGSSIYHIVENEVYVINTDKGTLKSKLILNINKSVPISMFISGEKLIVISEKTNGANKETLLFTFNLKAVSQTPVSSYSQSGEYRAIHIKDNYLTLLTEAVYAFSDAKKADAKTYVPFITKGKKQNLIALDDIVVTPELRALDYMVISGLDLSKTDLFVSTKAVLCGGSGGFSLGENGVYLASNIYKDNSYKTALRNFSADKGVVSSGNIIELDGKTTLNTISQNKDNLYVASTNVTQGEGDTKKVLTGLSIFDKELNLKSRVENLAGNSLIGKIVFNDKYIGLVTTQKKPATYFIDISGEQPAISKDTVSTLDYVPFGDKMGLSFTVAADANGNRTGIKVSLCDISNTVKPVEKTSVIASAHSSVSGDWNAYITSECLDDKSTLLIDTKNSIVGVPLVYFDGISQIDEYIFYKYADGKFTSLGRITLYDGNHSSKHCVLIDDIIYSLWDDTVISADVKDIKIISEFKVKDSEETPE